MRPAGTCQPLFLMIAGIRSIWWTSGTYCIHSSPSLGTLAAAFQRATLLLMRLMRGSHCVYDTSFQLSRRKFACDIVSVRTMVGSRECSTLLRGSSFGNPPAVRSLATDVFGKPVKIISDFRLTASDE